MKPETIAKARTMLASVLWDGLSYREAGAPFGLGRSTVERSIKGLVLEVAREHTGLSEKELRALLDPAALAKGGVPGKPGGGA